MKRFLLATLMAASLSSCIENGSLSPNKAQLRVQNVSNVSYDEVFVGAGGGGDKEFGRLEPGEYSDYAEFEFIYRYGFLKVEIGQDTLYLIPIDYVGETQYKSGKFTYEIGLFENRLENGSLTLNFERD
ncbi:MAG: hypothetical protein AAGC85_12650 [Bacteroidota bacterium]